MMRPTLVIVYYEITGGSCFCEDACDCDTIYKFCIYVRSVVNGSSFVKETYDTYSSKDLSEFKAMLNLRLITNTDTKTPNIKIYRKEASDTSVDDFFTTNHMRIQFIPMAPIAPMDPLLRSVVNRVDS